VANRLATFASFGAALLVLLVYAPALQAPFLVPKFAALEVTASVGFLAFCLARAAGAESRWARPIRTGALSVLAATLIAWVVAWRTTLGAPYALDAVARWGALFGLACGTSVLGDTRRQVVSAVTIGAAVVAGVGLLQHFELLKLSIPVFSTPGSTFGNRNLAAEVIAMALPCGLGALAGARSDTRVAMVCAVSLELVFLAVTRTRGAWLGAAVGLAAALFLARRRWSRASIAAGSVALVIAAVAAAVPGRPNPHDAGDAKRYSGILKVLGDSFDPSSTAPRTRFGLWSRTLQIVRHDLLTGVGPGNWPVVFPRYAEPGAMRDGVLTATVAPRQAHNDLLQLTAETGAVGLFAFGLLIAGTTIAVARRLRIEDEEDRAQTAAAAGALVALVALGLAGFPLEMPGTLALAGLALGLVAAEPQAEARGASASPVTTWKRWAAYAGAVLAMTLMVGAAVRAERTVRASAWLGAAERSMMGDPPLALQDLERASSASPKDFLTRFRMAQVLSREGRPLDAAIAARQALAAEPYSPNAWAALAGAELAAGDPRSARNSASRALGILEDYPMALGIRRVAAEQEGDLVAAQQDREHLETLAKTCLDADTSAAAAAILKAGLKSEAR
jgi:O-antigen ligase